MAPSAVTDGHVLEIWTRMNRKRSRARVGRVRFRVGQHVRISNEKMKFAKDSEQNYTDEIFKINKVINRAREPSTNWRISTVRRSKVSFTGSSRRLFASLNGTFIRLIRF